MGLSAKYQFADPLQWHMLIAAGLWTLNGLIVLLACHHRGLHVRLGDVLFGRASLPRTFVSTPKHNISKFPNESAGIGHDN